MRNLLLLAITFGVLAVAGCKAEDDDHSKDFDRGPILIQAADSIILPVFKGFQAKVNTLAEKVETFATTPDAASLAAVKSAWVAARVEWKLCEPFKFGPIENLGLENAVDIWPANVTGIESAIKNYDGTETYMNQVGSDKKGFSAIEYLLYNQAESETLTAFENVNRLAFLKLAVGDIQSVITQVLGQWDTTYAESFKSNTGNDAGASSTLLANELIYHIEVIKNYRVSLPLGTRTGSSTPLLDQVESPYAEISKELIMSSLVAAETVFTGGNGAGFDDYLDALGVTREDGTLLHEAILSQFELCKSDVNVMSGTLQETLVNDKAQVTKLYEDLVQLILLMKTEMMSQSGLLVVFSDNDGD